MPCVLQDYAAVELGTLKWCMCLDLSIQALFPFEYGYGPTLILLYFTAITSATALPCYTYMCSGSARQVSLERRTIGIVATIILTLYLGDPFMASLLLFCNIWGSEAEELSCSSKGPSVAACWRERRDGSPVRSGSGQVGDSEQLCGTPIPLHARKCLCNQPAPVDSVCGTWSPAAPR